MARKGKDNEWNIYDSGNTTWEKVPIAVLMDVRDEAKETNRLLRLYLHHLSALGCTNFLNIPNVLRRISRNTAKPRKQKG